MLALHAWLPASVKAAVFLFHGLQSHASWSWEIGEALAQRGVALFVLDRRGSGTSTGPHGAITDADTCLSDYITALDVSQSAIGNEVPFTLFGHCLGGSFLAHLIHGGGRDWAAGIA
ncbi:alpha/beta hydrolase [Komagataeibacter rhaeticus]